MSSRRVGSSVEFQQRKHSTDFHTFLSSYPLPVSPSIIITFSYLSRGGDFDPIQRKYYLENIFSSIVAKNTIRGRIRVVEPLFHVANQRGEKRRKRKFNKRWRKGKKIRTRAIKIDSFSPFFFSPSFSSSSLVSSLVQIPYFPSVQNEYTKSSKVR